MNPPNYDPRMVQNSQPRQQQYSQNGGGGGAPTKRYVQMPTGLPRSSTQMYQDDNYNESMHWDDGQGGNGGVGGGGSNVQQQEKPTGLRHFSTKVCEKVKEKGLTNYNEVADELVADYFQNNIMKQIDVVKQEYDMKNIRRRVYDALNVLLAMNIITKNKKDIRWIGLPASASQEISRLEEEKARREASIKAKKEALSEMIMQIVSYKNLVERNRKNEHKNGRPDNDTVLHLPFLIINTDKEANVECSVSSDKSEFLFSFDKKFEIHDDFEILKKLKLACGLDTGTSTEQDIKQAKSFLPSLHQHYVEDIIENHKRNEAEKEEKKKQMQNLASQQTQHLTQMQQYYDPSHTPNNPIPNQSSRFNRQLQEHLMNDGSEDRSAAAGIMERDDEMMEKTMNQGGPIHRASLYNYSQSPQKMRQQNQQINTPLQPPTTTRRYYVQKAGQGPIKREMSPAIRQQHGAAARHPYPGLQQPLDRRITSTTTVGQAIKYYVPQHGGSMHQQGAPRYRVRPPPPFHSQHQQHHQPVQRIMYSSGHGGPSSSSSSGGMIRELGPGQRIVTQRIVTPGGPHPPGTIVRKVIRKVVVNNSGAKQSPAQQVIQKKMMEQDMMPMERKPDQPMTSAQAAALIQHPPPEEYDYFQ